MLEREGFRHHPSVVELVHSKVLFRRQGIGGMAGDSPEGRMLRRLTARVLGPAYCSVL